MKQLESRICIDRLRDNFVLASITVAKNVNILPRLSLSINQLQVIMTVLVMKPRRVVRMKDGKGRWMVSSRWINVSLSQHDYVSSLISFDN